MSYELIGYHPGLRQSISDYEHFNLPKKDQVKYRKVAGPIQDDSDRSHVGTSSDDTPIPYFQDKGYDTPSSDDSFSGFGGGSGGGAGAGGSWDSDSSSSSSDSSSYDSGSSDSGSGSSSD